MVGRVADEVVLSDEERGFLETQARRRKAACSLSDRCRMILLCAEGLQSKEVGARLEVHEHTVGKWRRRFELMRWMPPPNGISYAMMVSSKPKGGHINDDTDQYAGD